jgi:hypothetical protein
MLLFSCRKDEDKDAPLIELNTPAENAQYDVFSDIPVTGTIYDNLQLAYVKIQLIDPNLIPVLPAIEIKPESNTLTLNQAYSVSDIHLKTGNYYLQVQAGDGIRVTNKFVSVRINEAPKKLKFLVAVTRSGSNLNVVKINSALQVSPLFMVTSDYLGSGCSSDFQQFYLCGRCTGNLLVYDVNTWQVNWDVPVTLDPPFPWFAGLMIDKGYCWVGYRDGRYEKYNPHGTKLLSVNTATGWSPLKFCITDNKLITEEKDYAGSGRMIELYYESSGAPLDNYFNAESTVAFVPLTGNEICHITNDQDSRGHIYIFNTYAVGEWEPPVSLSGKALCAISTGNDALIGHETGVYRCVGESSDLIGIIDGVHASALCCDETSHFLYVAEYKTLKQYYDFWPSVPFPQLLNTITLNDTILAVHAVYNKD